MGTRGRFPSGISTAKALTLLAIPLVMLTGCSQPASNANMGNNGNAQQQNAANGNGSNAADNNQVEQSAWRTVNIDDYGTTVDFPSDPKVTTSEYGKTYTVWINSKPEYMIMVDDDIAMGMVPNAPALQEYSDTVQRDMLWAFMKGSGAQGNYSSITVAGRPAIKFDWKPNGQSWHGVAVRGQTKHGAIVLLAADGTSEEDQAKLIDSVKFAE